MTLVLPSLHWNCHSPEIQISKCFLVPWIPTHSTGLVIFRLCLWMKPSVELTYNRTNNRSETAALVGVILELPRFATLRDLGLSKFDKNDWRRTTAPEVEVGILLEIRRSFVTPMTTTTKRERRVEETSRHHLAHPYQEFCASRQGVDHPTLICQ